MQTINLNLLVEDKKDFKLLGTYSFNKSPSSRRPLEIIRQLGSKAATKPKELLKELGIQNPKGENEYEIVFNAIKQAIENNETFSKFFTNVEFNTEVEGGVVIITPVSMLFSDTSSDKKDRVEIEFMHPDIYVAAIILALQKIGAISTAIGSEPKKQTNRLKRHIIQADSGHVIVIDPENLKPNNN